MAQFSLSELNRYTGALLAVCAVLLLIGIYGLEQIEITLRAWHRDFRKAHRLDELEEFEDLQDDA